MFSCGSCFDADPVVLGWTTGRHADQNRLICDPIWHSLLADADRESAADPVPGEVLASTVLVSSGMGEAIAKILAKRISGDGDPSKLEQVLVDVLDDHPSIVESARQDLLKIRSDDPATSSLLQPFLFFKGFLALQTHRIANRLWKEGRQTLAYHLQSRVSEVFGVDIHPAATIGSGVFLDHGSGIVIRGTAGVADGVTILHGVTLGGTGNEGGDRHPKIQRGVMIGAGSQLLGNISIGEEAKVGAGSVVLHDVEPRSTVAGVPAKVVRHRKAAIPIPRVQRTG